MNVAALRSKVTFQKNETVTDKYGNHKNVWTDYYTCFATITGTIRMSGRIIIPASRRSAARVWQVPRKSRSPGLRWKKIL